MKYHQFRKGYFFTRLEQSQSNDQPDPDAAAIVKYVLSTPFFYNYKGQIIP